jgi:SNF2 family DNA or RNA helicase
MIELRQTEPGFVTIDFSNEPSFDPASDGLELSTGLFVTETTPTSLVVEDAGQLGPVISYISKCFTSLGFEVRLDAGLQEWFHSFQSERELVERIRAGAVAEPILKDYSSYSIVRPLLDHQIRGIKHGLRVQHAANFSVPGSGKTMTALCVFAVLKSEGTVNRILLVGPASSFVPWQEEFRQTFGRDANTVRLIGNSARRAEMLAKLDGVELLLCTYQMAYRERQNLLHALRRDKYLLILDESHCIKNIDLGPWASTAQELSPYATRRMILTGTPMPRSPRDLWSQFTFLWPSEALLKDRSHFDQRASSLNVISELKPELSPFFIRTKKSDLRLPKSEMNFFRITEAEIPHRQKLVIRLLELKTLQQAKNLGLGTTDVSTLRRWRRARTIRLLQAASNPALLASSISELGETGEALDSEPTLTKLLRDYSQVEIPAKVKWTVDTVRRLISEKRKVVVWATHVKNLTLLNELLAEFSPLLVYGGVPAYEEDADSEFENREKNIREFKTRADRPLLLANPGACSESISLHAVCQDAIYLERTFNCGQFLQSMDRINRVGMLPGTHATYHIPLISCAIEHVLDTRLAERQRALYELLDDDMPVLGYEEGSLLLEREEDLEAIFHQVLQRIEKNVTDKGNAGDPRPNRTRR